MSSPTASSHPEDTAPPPPPTPAALLRVFVGVALSGIGGGLPAHARRALTARQWMTDAQFAESYTLAQLTPGPNAVNLAAMIGARLCGPRGAALAVIGILTPGLAAMLVAAALTLGGGAGLPPAVQSGLRGAACAALAVMGTAALPVVKVALGVRGGMILAALAFVGLGVLRLDLLPVFATLVGLGLILNRPRRIPPRPTTMPDVSVWALILEFTRLGLISFGGTNIAEIERVLVGQHHWITPSTLANGFALGQLMPGPNMLAVTYYGYAAAGLGGALAATLGFYGPTALLSATAALAWRRFSTHPWLVAFRDALLPFGAGVLLAGVLVLGQTSVHSWAGAGIAAAAFVILWRSNVNSVIVVIGAALVGALLGL